jgi:hypothetical protein
MTKREQYNEYVFRVCSALDIDRQDYLLFRRRGATLHRLYEEQCNGYQDYKGDWSERLTQESEAKEQRLYDLVENQARELGLYVYFQTDPRGATIYLDKEPVPENNYTRAHCVY